MYIISFFPVDLCHAVVNKIKRGIFCIDHMLRIKFAFLPHIKYMCLLIFFNDLSKFIYGYRYECIRFFSGFFPGINATIADNRCNNHILPLPTW